MPICTQSLEFVVSIGWELMADPVARLRLNHLWSYLFRKIGFHIHSVSSECPLQKKKRESDHILRVFLGSQSAVEMHLYPAEIIAIATMDKISKSHKFVKKRRDIYVYAIRSVF